MLSMQQVLCTWNVNTSHTKAAVVGVAGTRRRAKREARAPARSRTAWQALILQGLDDWSSLISRASVWHVGCTPLGGWLQQQQGYPALVPSDSVCRC
jgi:hypothetical protein